MDFIVFKELKSNLKNYNITEDIYICRYKYNIYSFNYLQINLEDMKRSFELSVIILLSLKNVYSMFNRTDDPKVQLNGDILLRCVMVQQIYIS